MIPTLTLLSGSGSIKKPVTAALAVVAVMLSLPIIALISVTNIAALGWGNGSPYQAIYIYNDPITPGDKYDYGFCTYWAALRRIQINKQIPNDWGDAHSWDNNAELQGYEVDHTPSLGAIMQTDAGDLGHVAFVENVDPITGAWTISEMNAVGWDEVDQRTFPASAAFRYNFIHEQKNEL